MKGRHSTVSLWNPLSFSCPLLVSTFLGVWFAFPSIVLAWDPFLVENSHVAHGNERLRGQDADGALHEYEAAARQLPAEPGVHLDRGLALLAKGVLDRAREALLVATEPPAAAPIRADAYYDLGVAFYRAGDTTAAQAAQQATQGGANPLQGAPGQTGQAEPPHAEHREASRLFREAADSYRRSLRARPGNRDAAWNLELALRRIREEDERQRQQDEQERQQQEQQQQGQQGQQDQQGGQQGQQQQQQQGDSQNGQQPQHPQDQHDQGQQGQQQQGQQGQQPSQQPNGAQGQQPQDQQAHSVGGNDQPAQTDATQSQQHSADGLPANVARVLDALPDSTVERARARAQAVRENREPAQDW